jgi:hypothetical protein
MLHPLALRPLPIPHPTTRHTTTQALGRHLDSVVVDSERTARDAIQYLKDNKVPRLTFIPLATIKVCEALLLLVVVVLLVLVVAVVVEGQQDVKG